MRVIVAITGASGAVYGIRLLEALKKLEAETHLIISKWGAVTIQKETDYAVEKVEALADFYYNEYDLTARVSSGSFKCDGMIIAPCSMKTLAGIASGYTESLVIRAADVTIKEKRRLVLMVRETPLSSIHLENMLKLSRAGVTIMPPVPEFYTKPGTIHDIIDQTVLKALEHFGAEVDSLKRWDG